jgi:hypothetical protein
VRLHLDYEDFGGIAVIRSIASTLIALLAMADLAVPVRASTISISGTLSGDSTLTATGTPGDFVQNFTGSGDDTPYGHFTAQSPSAVDFSNPPNIIISGGSFTETFTSGTLFGTSSGSGSASQRSGHSDGYDRLRVHGRNRVVRR